MGKYFERFFLRFLNVIDNSASDWGPDTPNSWKEAYEQANAERERPNPATERERSPPVTRSQARSLSTPSPTITPSTQENKAPVPQAVRILPRPTPPPEWVALPGVNLIGGSITPPSTSAQTTPKPMRPRRESTSRYPLRSRTRLSTDPASQKQEERTKAVELQNGHDAGVSNKPPGALASQRQTSSEKMVTEGVDKSAQEEADNMGSSVPSRSPSDKIGIRSEKSLEDRAEEMLGETPLADEAVLEVPLRRSRRRPSREGSAEKSEKGKTSKANGMSEEKDSESPATEIVFEGGTPGRGELQLIELDPDFEKDYKGELFTYRDMVNDEGDRSDKGKVHINPELLDGNPTEQDKKFASKLVKRALELTFNEPIRKRLHTLETARLMFEDIIAPARRVERRRTEVSQGDLTNMFDAAYLRVTELQGSL